MPEGDTIWRLARRLHEAFAGTVLTRFELRVPRYAAADLRGHVVREVGSRGKHLLMRIEPDLTLHSHLGMDGSWRLRSAAGRPPGQRAAAVRAVLANAEQLAVGSDLAQLNLVRSEDEPALVGRLGPDLMSDQWDPAEAVRRLAGTPDRPIGEALLDQQNLAGIGNVYQAELLFLRGIRPDAPVRAAGDLDRMVRLARDLMWSNRWNPSHITTGDRRPDRRHWVYRRAGLPCRRCGTPIEQGRIGPPGRNRIAFWCPHCQPGGDT